MNIHHLAAIQNKTFEADRVRRELEEANALIEAQEKLINELRADTVLVATIACIVFGDDAVDKSDLELLQQIRRLCPEE